MEIKKIAELAKILKDNRLTKLDLTEGDTRIVLEAAEGRSAEEVFVQPKNADADINWQEKEKPDEAEQGYAQKCPLVGTVYLAPQAGAEPFVKVGDRVDAGSALCIVESMKMFNTIEAEVKGIVEEICVNNGQLVEFGQPLVIIREEA